LQYFSVSSNITDNQEIAFNRKSKGGLAGGLKILDQYYLIDYNGFFAR